MIGNVYKLMIISNNMKKLKCKKCDHEWTPREDNPRQCPKCKSYYWNIIVAKCEVCNRSFNTIHLHHIDGNRKNNKKENQIYVCVDCHSIIHNGLKNNEMKSIYQKSKQNGKSRIRSYKNKTIIKRHLDILRKKWLNSDYNMEKSK